MKRNLFFVFIVMSLLVSTSFSTSFALAVTTGGFSSRSAVSVTYQQAPSFQTYYGDKATTYWPILGDKETCEARQDFMLQVAPFGCQPVVVRSDLLAEQNVPVFCQINAINVNPLVQVEQIKNIQFKGQYPPEVVGSGFHPARAALRTHNVLLGSPLVNNVGYVVVVLKRQPDESKLPDSINVSLQAAIEYSAGNAYGIGRSEFVLTPTTETEWETEKLKQSFWNGRYSIRLEEVDDTFAIVSIYEGDVKVSTTRVNKGQTSQKIYVPGMYCRAALTISYDNFVAAETKARIEVSSGNGIDSFDVYKGSTFIDGRCSVSRIDSDESSGEAGRVVGSCQGKQFVLELKSRDINITKNSIYIRNVNYSVVDRGQGQYSIDLRNAEKETLRGDYFIDADQNLIRSPDILIFNSSNGAFGSSVREEDKEFYTSVYQAMGQFIQGKIGFGGQNKTISNSYFEQAIDAYETVAEDYTGENGGAYGEEALEKAITLARVLGKDDTRLRLINRYLELYPNGRNTIAYIDESSRMQKFDSSLAGEAIEFDEGTKVIRLVSLSQPSKLASANLIVDEQDFPISKGEIRDITQGNNRIAQIALDDVQVNDVKVGAYCYDNNGNLSKSKQNYVFRLNEDAKQICNGPKVKLDSTDLEKAAKIRLTPSAEGTRTETNLTVFVGIEKRAIQLTPNKVAEKIENLNKTIAKWEKITQTLGKVVSGLKTACFATAGLLTFKNFMSGLSGETLARQQVMQGENGWTERCKALVPTTYPTLDACFTAKASEIDSEVARTTAAIERVNAQIEQIQSQHPTDSGSLFGKSVDTEKVRSDLAARINEQYGEQTIDMGDTPWRNEDGTTSQYVKIKDMLTEKNVKNGIITTDGMRSLMLNAELSSQDLTAGHQEHVASQLKTVAGQVNGGMISDWEFAKSKEKEKNGYPPLFYAGSANAQERVANVAPITEQIRQETGFGNDVTHVAVVGVNPGSLQQGDQTVKFEPGSYVLGLNGDAQTGTYTVQKVVKQGSTTALDPADFTSTYKIGNIKSVDRVSYRNRIQDADRYVRYYETEPYRGMPAIVPFDAQEGWYAATRQTLPTFGGIGAFDASGRVTSFWVCNVGTNGKIEFNTGYGDDLCQQINTQTGQPINVFPGLDSTKASQLVQRAQRAIEDAARQHGNKFVTVAGERFEVGAPEVGTPGTNCQDFMSPKDCNLLFNVCDPVICPSSRCDFGGTYRVANVVQSGIVGSIFLCLPNIREGIFIPVCLSGIHAGIEGFVSIMKNYRDCLQQNLDTGEMVGICDEIYSIYLCEFFWNELAPLVNVLLPKMIELAYGQGVRGGAEYLSVMSAWQNMENSINYFTQSYAVNSIQAFQARNVEEVGTQFCKAFVSVKSPTALKSLVAPDSPPQFHAWFDQKTFTSATVPATSQYKVFYHIFAGNDQGVYFSVYLKNPPQTGYYAATPTIAVANGFINKGDYKSETRDFTAPEGYKELCVRINDDEECGFGQVSTSFAVNYLRDAYVSSELQNTAVTSQEACVSGTHNPGALLNPNIQAGVESTVSPDIYNRGVVRICASQNPGSGTDPTRFTDVGYCDDQKVRCWIDKRSVEQAITQGNIGLKNETLEVLQQRTNDLLNGEDFILDNSTADANLLELQSVVATLKTGADVTKAQNVLTQADTLEKALFWNHHKAQLLIIKGDAYSFLAQYYRLGDDKARRDARGIVDTSTPGGNGGTNDPTPVWVNDPASNYAFVVSSEPPVDYGATHETYYNLLKDDQKSNYYVYVPHNQAGAPALNDEGKVKVYVKFLNGTRDYQDIGNVFGNRIDLRYVNIFHVTNFLGNEEAAHVHGATVTGLDRILPDGIVIEPVPAVQPTLPPVNPVARIFDDARCGTCGNGFWNVCDFEECNGLGDCNFIIGDVWYQCASCRAVQDCSGYSNDLACNSDMCTVAGSGKKCGWQNDRCIRVDAVSAPAAPTQPSTGQPGTTRGIDAPTTQPDSTPPTEELLEMDQRFRLVSLGEDWEVQYHTRANENFAPLSPRLFIRKNTKIVSLGDLSTRVLELDRPLDSLTTGESAIIAKAMTQQDCERVIVENVKVSDLIQARIIKKGIIYEIDLLQQTYNGCGTAGNLIFPNN